MLQTLRSIWRITGEYHRRFAAIVAGIFLVNLFQTVLPFVNRALVDSIITGQLDVQRAAALIAIGFGAEMLQTYARMHLFEYVNRLLFKVELDLLNSGLAKLLGLSMAFHETGATGGRVQRISRGTSNVDRILSDVLQNVLPTAAQVLISFAVLMSMSRPAALIFLVGMPIFIVVTTRFDRVQRPFRKRINDAFEKSSGLLTQLLFHVQTVQSFAREDAEVLAHTEITDSIRRDVRGQQIAGRPWALLREMIQQLAYAGVFAIGLYQVAHGSITVGTLLLIVTVSNRAYGSLFDVTRTYDRIADSAEPVARLMEVMATESEVRDAPDALSPAEVKGRVAFEHVSFGYSPDRSALEDINFEVDPGEQAAFVGPSGGGKSTLVKLLFRHYDPQEGAVLLDGTDLRQLKRTAFRSHFGIVTQDVEVFSGTVRENISYPDPEASLERVMEISRLAHAHEFIEKLPEGYETQIGEKGIKLSGGQRQRLGIARALLRDPAVLIFDEATSHLDSESERLIQAALEKIRGQRTIIVIAHRLSTVQHSDKIFVIEQGRIVEQGSHATLLQQGGLYRKLTQLQDLGAVLSEEHKK